MTQVLLSAIHFTGTVTLGAALIAGALGLVGLYRVYQGADLRSTNEIQRRRLEALEGDLGDKERRLNELGAEKDREATAHAAAEARARTLEKQLESMPDYNDVVLLQARTMDHVDEKAADRQGEIVTKMAEIFDQHEQRAQERHDAQLKLSRAIVDEMKDLRKGIT